MLRIPSFRQGDGFTVYQDDAVWYRFYLVPSAPAIRRDSNGRPVFLLSIFHTSDDSRAVTPTAPRGGGFMNFDVQFSVPAETTRTAKDELQQWVNEEYARRKSDPKNAGVADYAGANAPTVELADPLYSGGKVMMQTTQSTLLVSGRFAEAPASLVGGSGAVFNIDLTETGASFMHDLFLGTDGGGRADLTPVQVIYAMTMEARLPPIAITVTGDSERIHQTLTKVSQTTRDNICTPAEIESFRETGTSSSALRETGLVDVKIDKGDATVPEEALKVLQDYALNLFDTMIKERFLVPADTDHSDMSFDTPIGGVATAPASKPVSRYKVRETINTATMHLQIKVDRSQVVDWPVGGQATLETFFAGASAEELKRHVVDITADEFNSLGVTVQALVDFDKMPVQAIEVQAEYTAVDGSGTPHTTNGGWTFRAGETASQKFDPTVFGGTREYRYRYRVTYDDGTTDDYTEWETTSTRSLNVAIADPGKLQLEVSAASLNWDVLRAIRVDLTYTEAGASAPPIQQSYELTKATPVRKWERQFNRAMRGSIAGRATYFMADDKVVEGSPVTIEPTNTLYLVPPPQVDVLNVGLLPAGNWSDVAQAAVSMQYDAGDGRVFDKTFRFTAIDQAAEWTVLLRDPNRRAFKYKPVIIYKSGGKDEPDWTSKTGDQTVIIDVKGTPRLRVNVLSNLVDFARTPAVTVNLAYGSERRTLAFTASTAQTWEVPLAADGSREYTYTIGWRAAEGQTVTSGPTRTADTELFIPRAQLPTIGKLDVMLRGFAIDFAVTPFVDVALVWQDGAFEERKTITLSKDQVNAVWSVPIGDRTQRRYHYAITYNLADGTRVPGKEGDTDDPVVSVTRYQPQA